MKNNKRQSNNSLNTNEILGKFVIKAKANKLSSASSRKTNTRSMKHFSSHKYFWKRSCSIAANPKLKIVFVNQSNSRSNENRAAWILPISIEVNDFDLSQNAGLQKLYFNKSNNSLGFGRCYGINSINGLPVEIGDVNEYFNSSHPNSIKPID